MVGWFDFVDLVGGCEWQVTGFLALDSVGRVVVRSVEIAPPPAPDSPARRIASVGTRIAGRTLRASISAFISESAAAAAGLALRLA